ncbi:MAG: glycosyltransferase [bacterium]
MRLVMFYHSLRSDWNHGNAHFLRGVVRELITDGHTVTVYEPADGWSIRHLREAHGDEPIRRFHRAYPTLDAIGYDPTSLDLDAALDRADVVVVHEWTPTPLIERIGRRRARGGEFTLLFHDTHHRSVSDAASLEATDLSGYDGVLAFGEVIRRRYIERGWGQQVFTWHEAADVRVFRPITTEPKTGDLVWIGNWGDDERDAELRAFLIEPVRRLGLSAAVHGVRYPDTARAALAEAGIDYRGWLANFDAPQVFARHRLTVHVPRRPYVEALPGIPTIRVFEALACGIPLVSAPWRDEEGLFRPGEDYLVAHDTDEMTRHLDALLRDPERAAAQASAGLETIHARHTCAHRADELLAICRRLGARVDARDPRKPSQTFMPSPLI